jgi:hypothetical protein
MRVGIVCAACGTKEESPSATSSVVMRRGFSMKDETESLHEFSGLENFW